MMNKFALGVVTACLFTTIEGRQIVGSTSKVALTIGDKILKNKLGIDVKTILEDKESEDK